MKLLKLIKVLLTTVCLSVFSIAGWAEGVEIHNAWIRHAPANAKVLALYGMIENHSNTPLSIIKVESPFFERSELHRSSRDDQNMMRMVKQDRIIVLAQDQLILQPSGWHIMLFGPKKRLSIDELVPVSVYFDNDTMIEVMATVRTDNRSISGTHIETH